MSLASFHPRVRTWFTENLGAPTPPQTAGWRSILAGEHTLIAAPTGSGKTLAAFLAALDDLLRQGADLQDETRVLYISPLKALGNDVRKNLQRYGVVVRRVLMRERLPVPWRVLLRVFRRLELRGEVRGGRFVHGCDGEHFALESAVQLLREIRRRDATPLRVAAADPLNLRGILTPDEKVASHTQSWVEVL